MHGEYKVPGGKLVAVDVEHDGERLTSVEVSGDFFLEPDEALDQINAALLDQPITNSANQLAQRIQASLSDDVAMYGFDPAAVGIAVKRALGDATSWDDHLFEVIGPKTMDPVMHVALDQVLTQKVAAGERRPTLRFWEWDSPLVVIGSFQSFSNEIDKEGARRHGIDVIRRVSGGGAMFMEAGNCITFSMHVPTSLVEGLSFEQSYAFLDDWVLNALGELGIKARYVPINDIVSDKGKIAGAAQKRYAAGSVLHHVTMSYDIDADKMLEVLRIGREKMSDKGHRSANKRVDPLRSQTGMPRTQIIEAFQRSFKRNHRTIDGDYTDDELAEAAELMKTKFKTDGWRYRVP